MGKIFLVCLLVCAVPITVIEAQSLEDTNQSDIDQRINQYQKKSNRLKILGYSAIGGGILVPLLTEAAEGDSYSTSTGISDIGGGVGTAMFIASIPLFLSSRANQKKADMLRWKKTIDQAKNDSLRRIEIENAAHYFNGKASGRKRAGWITLGVGTGLVVTGLIAGATNDDYYFEDFAAASLGIAGGVVALLSIPSFINARRYENTADLILQSGTVPDPELSSATPVFQPDGYLALGVRIHL